MADVPADAPLTIPLDDPTVATAGVALCHVPPAVALLSVVVPDTHTESVPVIAAGTGFTVIVATDIQPDAVVV
jgi:hypothetical protein